MKYIPKNKIIISSVVILAVAMIFLAKDYFKANNVQASVADYSFNFIGAEMKVICVDCLSGVCLYDGYWYDVEAGTYSAKEEFYFPSSYNGCGSVLSPCAPDGAGGCLQNEWILYLTNKGAVPPFGSFASAECHQYNSSNSMIPVAGFGAAWNVYSASKETLMKADCSQSNSFSFKVGNGSQDVIIYKTGYYWQNNKWNQFTFSGTSASDIWLRGDATYNLTNPPDKGYIVAYFCQYINGVWKCGCSHSACNPSGSPKTGNLWNLQKWVK